MTRRALLSMLALAVADPDRLIWQPGRKLISIPKPTPLMSWSTAFPPTYLLAVAADVYQQLSPADRRHFNPLRYISRLADVTLQTQV